MNGRGLLIWFLRPHPEPASHPQESVSTETKRDRLSPLAGCSGEDMHGHGGCFFLFFLNVFLFLK